MTQLHVGGPCESARLRASLALDDDPDEGFDLVLLERHVAGCAECAALVAAMREATASLRRAPLVAHRCTVRPCRARRLPWAHIAAVALTIAAAVVVVPPSSDPRRPGVLRPAFAEPPPPLPIGQRSAVDDFLYRSPAT